MLIVNNGAMKSGTSWVQRILVGVKPHDELPERWRREGWTNPSIDEGMLEKFLVEEDFSAHDYIIKSHYPPEVAPVLVRDDVLVIGCARSIPDMVLSHYHHLKRHNKTQEDLETWMSKNAVRIARSRIDYLNSWAPFGPTMHFEEMFADPEAAALKVARLVSSPLTEEEVRQVGREAQLTPSDGQIREGAHVRSGRPGRAREELTAEMFASLTVLDAELLKIFPERKGFN